MEKLLTRFEETGIYEIENIEVLKLPYFQRLGKPARIVQLFGGREGYFSAVKKLEDEIYKDVETA